MDTIKRLRALLDAATSSPWAVCKYRDGASWVGSEAPDIDGGVICEPPRKWPESMKENAENFALVAALRNNAPALLDVAEAAEVALEHRMVGVRGDMIGKVAIRQEDKDAIHAALTRLRGETEDSDA